MLAALASASRERTAPCAVAAALTPARPLLVVLAVVARSSVRTVARPTLPSLAVRAVTQAPSLGMAQTVVLAVTPYWRLVRAARRPLPTPQATVVLPLLRAALVARPARLTRAVLVAMQPRPQARAATPLARRLVALAAGTSCREARAALVARSPTLALVARRRSSQVTLARRASPLAVLLVGPSRSRAALVPVTALAVWRRFKQALPVLLAVLVALSP